MDIEKLSKSQIILLTLLVSFVTSIATGVVTVSLMEQAPPAIAQTVNRVVERTVEKMVPAQTAAAGTTVEKTVVIKESDLIAEALKKAEVSIVRIYSSEEQPLFVGLGTVVGSDGTIVGDADAIGEMSDAIVETSAGARVRAFVVKRDDAAHLAYFQAATSSQSGPLVWTPASLEKAPPQLGETVFMIAGKSTTHLESGIITSLLPQDGGYSILQSNIPADSIADGSPLVSLDGTILGVSTALSRASAPSGFLPAEQITPASAQKKPN